MKNLTIRARILASFAIVLTQLSEAAQQTVDSFRQSGQAIDELNRVAIGLRDGVSRFTLQAA